MMVSIATPLTFVEPDESEADAWLQERAQPLNLPRFPSITVPNDGRPFLISIEDRQEIKPYYRCLIYANAIITVLGLALFPFASYLVLYQ